MGLKNYLPFESPFPLNLHEQQRKIAEAYFRWFVEHVPVRISVLRQALDANGGSFVALDATAESFATLGKWLDGVLETRLRTEEEMEIERRKTPDNYAWTVSPLTLTGESLSLCFDVGCYVGWCMCERHLSLHWDIVRRPKSNVDFQRPVIV